MGIKWIAGGLSGIWLLEAEAFSDARGYFMEAYHQGKCPPDVAALKFVQDNLSYSTKGVLRGLHYQLKNPQAKLVSVIRGEVFDVAVDIRRDSPSFGKWFGAHLSENNHRQMFIPGGFAHGFCVLSDEAYVHYKCSEIYRSEDDCGIFWGDPEIGISWPIQGPMASAKDQQLPTLAAAGEIGKLPRS